MRQVDFFIRFASRAAFPTARLAAVLILSNLFLLLPSAGQASLPAKPPIAGLDQPVKSSTDLDQFVYLPLVMKNWKGTKLLGQVVRAENGAALTGVQVCADEGRCTDTGSNGDYVLNLDTGGEHIFDVTASGYLTATETIPIVYNEWFTYTFTLSEPLTPTLGLKDRISVTWDPTPEFVAPNGTWYNDLDTHLYVDFPSDPDIHIFNMSYEGACNIYPYTGLKTWANQGRGPETIDVAQYLDGVYYFGVHNANYIYAPGYVPAIPDLDVVVRIYKEDNQISLYTPPTSGTGNFWYLFNMDSTGTITITNCIIDYPPDDQLPACP